MSCSKPLVLLALFVCTGCPVFQKQAAKEDEADPETGELSMGLTLPDHTDVVAVDYTITKGVAPKMAGKMAIGEEGTAGVTVNGLEPGTDYRADLSSKRLLNLPCVGKTEFVVREGKLDLVDVKMQCEQLDDPYDPND